MPHRRSVRLLAAAGLIGGAVTAVALPATSQASPQPKLVRLTTNLLPGLSRYGAGVAPNASQQMTVGISLVDRHAAAETALLNKLADPSSPLYDHWLTAAQVKARFSEPAAVTRNVESRLKAAGLTVNLVSMTGDYISARGSVADVDRAFDIDERRFTTKSGGTFLANTRGPLVPAADEVQSIVGLNTLQRFAVPKQTTHLTHTKQSTCEAGVCLGLTTPRELWKLYDEPSKFKGQGQRMAIIGDGNTTITINALRKFEATNKLPKVAIKTICPERHSCGADDPDGDGEWAIDTQASTGMAPSVKSESLYFAQSDEDADINYAFLGWLDDKNAPKQASASLGECEETPLNSVFTGPLGPINGNQNFGTAGILGLGNGEEQVLDPQLRKADLMGRTLFSSAGDTGFTCASLYLPAVGGGNGLLYNGAPNTEDYPAASPYVVSVGGTVLYTKDQKTPARALEYGWNFGGGGWSSFETAPSWQKSNPNIIGRCLTTPTGSTSNTGQLCRGVPDVAAQSGDAVTNGYDVCSPSACDQPGAGTSLSSPLWLGMWTRIQAASGGKLGFAAPLIYRLGNNATTYARDFNDVTVGDNGFPATKGWDYVTGFGTPKVANLITDAKKTLK